MGDASVFDVAQYILGRKGPMTAMKLQKLVYYTQAWSLAWHNGLLFNEPIEAREHGPVVRTLWNDHRGQWLVKHLTQGDPDQLAEDATNIVDAVLGRYGGLDPEVLSELTHAEEPWRKAYEHGSSTVIDPNDLMMYYQKIGTELLQDFGPADAMDSFSFYLLLMQVTPENRHTEVDWGLPMGKEIW